MQEERTPLVSVPSHLSANSYENPKMKGRHDKLVAVKKELYVRELINNDPNNAQTWFQLPSDNKVQALLLARESTSIDIFTLYKLFSGIILCRTYMRMHTCLFYVCLHTSFHAWADYCTNQRAAHARNPKAFAEKQKAWAVSTYILL